MSRSKRYIAALFLWNTLCSFGQNLTGNDASVELAGPKTLSNRLLLLGEIKGISYIKVTLRDLEDERSYSESSNILKYRGSYYESITGKTYSIVGLYNSETRLWTLQSFDSDNTPFGLFTGKQTIEGDITGDWKLKEKSYPFSVL